MVSEVTEYEREREARIAENKAVMRALGLEGHVTTPDPKPRRAPVKRALCPPSADGEELNNRSDRILRARPPPGAGRASPGATTGEPARVPPRREASSSAATDAPEADHEYATPPRARPARAPTKAHAQTALAPLEPAHFQLLADGLDSSKWIEDMESNFLNNSAVYLAYCGRLCSPSNCRSVVNALKRMSGVEGTAHPYNPAAPLFRKDMPLTASSDTAQIIAEAVAWLEKYGADKSNGWLLTHPLRKLRLYQDWKVFGLNGADPAGHLHDN